MNIYKISQTVNNQYDTYDACIVCAVDEESAKNWNPAGTNFNNDGTITDEHKGFLTPDKERYSDFGWETMAWCAREHVHVELIGVADPSMKEGFILCSFNAG